MLSFDRHAKLKVPTMTFLVLLASLFVASTSALHLRSGALVSDAQPNIIETVLNFKCASSYQEVILPDVGVVNFKIAGAAGATIVDGYFTSIPGGKGGYASGTIEITSSTRHLYIFVGCAGRTSGFPAFNGGQQGSLAGGGGGTDIRLDPTDLWSRIIVVGGGVSAYLVPVTYYCSLIYSLSEYIYLYNCIGRCCERSECGLFERRARRRMRRSHRGWRLGRSVSDSR